jgi:N-acetylated-alpha-linked acidic dipeptidase
VDTQANQLIRQVEQAFIAPEGLPGRDWYKNLLYAPGLLTGYTAKTLPGIREAVEAQRWTEAQQQADRLARAMRAAMVQIEAATQRLNETR